MIVNIRGTGGAGKSTLARRTMDRYPERKPIHLDGRKQPIGYECTRPGGRTLYVVGHYSTPCGGADTITNVPQVFSLVREAVTAGMDVLFEGIISQDDVVRTADLHRDFPGQLKVVALRVPIEECLAAVQQRRDERGDARPFNPKNTVDREKRLRGTVSRLRDASIDVAWMSRAEAEIAVCGWLGLE